ncbi:hypothetical protein NKH33_22245 [Mesorhizobium sp. M1182]
MRIPGISRTGFRSKSGQRSDQLPALQGEVPSAARVPKGCRFHPRCPLAFDRCQQEEPLAVEVGPQHLSACWLAK